MQAVAEITTVQHSEVSSTIIHAYIQSSIEREMCSGGWCQSTEGWWEMKGTLRIGVGQVSSQSITIKL